MYRALATFIALGLFLAPGHAQESDWPYPLGSWSPADWGIAVHRTYDATAFDPTNLRWIHLHRGNPAVPDVTVAHLAVTLRQPNTGGAPVPTLASSGIRVRYTLRGTPITPWLDPPFTFALSIDDPALATIPDGVHDLSVQICDVAADPACSGTSTALMRRYSPWAAYLHLSRDPDPGAPGGAFGFVADVPLISGNTGEYHNVTTMSFGDYNVFDGPRVAYVDPVDRAYPAYRANPDVTPWSHAPADGELYEELLAPHTPLFHPVQMWWAHPAHPGYNLPDVASGTYPFLRPFPPKHSEDHRNLRVTHGHERFPVRDGVIGRGWMSPYISGSIGPDGRFAFAETSGRVGCMMPDGEIVTIAGWRVRHDRDPIWFQLPTALVRSNMENRGNWVPGASGRGEFFTPLDVAIDPLDSSVWYVVGYEDHVIWRVQLPPDPRTQDADITILAGAPDHATGFVDGNGAAARFNGTTSIVFDPVADVMYVADQENDAIRRVTRDGTVTTVAGVPGMQQRLIDRGVTEWWDYAQARPVSDLEVTAPEATAGIRPELFAPHVVRVDSRGNLIFADYYGLIRKLYLSTDAESHEAPGTIHAIGETKIMFDADQKHEQWTRGWIWLDVDRWGNAGPQDGIYWCKFVSTGDHELFNEHYGWIPPEGGTEQPLFRNATGLYPDGWGPMRAGGQNRVNAPHYPWLIAVDPRGALLLAGGGEHGLVRVRKPRADDPAEPDGGLYARGRWEWHYGTYVPSWTGEDDLIDDGGAPLSLRFGHNGHNYFGAPGTWQHRNSSDDELLAAFGVADSIVSNSIGRDSLLAFLRPNTEITVVPPCPADASGDGQVDATDLLALLSAWGPCTGCAADLNGDGQVDVADLLQLLTAWGDC